MESLLHFDTEKNNDHCEHTVISPGFLVFKFCGKAQFPQNFHTRKSGEITVFFAVDIWLMSFHWLSCLIKSCTPCLIITDYKYGFGYRVEFFLLKIIKFS